MKKFWIVLLVPILVGGWSCQPDKPPIVPIPIVDAGPKPIVDSGPGPIDANPVVTIDWKKIVPCLDGKEARKAVKEHKLGWKANPKRHRGHKVGYRLTTGQDSFHQPNDDVLDQGDIGACPGFGTDGAASAWPFLHHASYNEALSIYSATTKIDNGCLWNAIKCPGSYPPNDTGSYGSSALSAAKSMGIIKDWSTADTFQEMLSELDHTTCIIGANWMTGMDAPDNCGNVTVSGTIRGGHLWFIAGHDVTGKRTLGRNSWGPYYAINGWFWIPDSGMEELFASGAESDCIDSE